jgi:hypothetical protein
MLAIAVTLVFAVTVMVAPTVTVSPTLVVPAVIMIEAAALSLPVAVIVSAALVARSDPRCTAVRRVSPITPVPDVAAVDHIPITVNPHVTRTRRNRSHTVHARWRRRADPDSDGYLSFKGG